MRIKIMKPYTIISDPGVDDLIALLLLRRLLPTPEHTLVSTFGNAPHEYTSQNAKEFIAFAAPRWFYAAGSDQPLKPLEHPWPAYFHGPDGVWNIHPEVSVAGVKKQTENLSVSDVVSLGPMTDVYHLMNKAKIEHITIMGGAINVPGNETVYAETNIAFDPDAAAYFFANCQGVKVNVVPLDVTTKVSWTKEKMLSISEDSAENVWLKKLLLTWFAQRRDESFDLHDPLAVYSMFFPEKLEWTTAGVKVLTEGEGRGRMILSATNPPCRVALHVQNPAQVADEIFDRTFSLA